MVKLGADDCLLMLYIQGSTTSLDGRKVTLFTRPEIRKGAPGAVLEGEESSSTELEWQGEEQQQEQQAGREAAAVA